MGGLVGGKDGRGDTEVGLEESGHGGGEEG